VCVFDDDVCVCGGTWNVELEEFDGCRRGVICSLKILRFFVLVHQHDGALLMS
jgi:hypothetical protein